MGICDGRVVIVTGSGRGIGREHALAYAREGAKVVVNDLGGDASGEGADITPAQQTVDDIKAMEGKAVDARIVNTSSPSGLFGNAGQTNYGAAKAGIASFTQICALELGRYGVNANAIAPVARTRMTENLGMGPAEEGKFDALDPA